MVSKKTTYTYIPALPVCHIYSNDTRMISRILAVGAVVLCVLCVSAVTAIDVQGLVINGYIFGALSLNPPFTVGITGPYSYSLPYIGQSITFNVVYGTALSASITMNGTTVVAAAALTTGVDTGALPLTYGAQHVFKIVSTLDGDYTIGIERIHFIHVYVFDFYFTTFTLCSIFFPFFFL